MGSGDDGVPAASGAWPKSEKHPNDAIKKIVASACVTMRDIPANRKAEERAEIGINLKSLSFVFFCPFYWSKTQKLPVAYTGCFFAELPADVLYLPEDAHDISAENFLDIFGAVTTLRERLGNFGEVGNRVDALGQ